MNIYPFLTEAERYLTLHDVDRAAELYVQAHAQCEGRSPLPRLGLARVALLMLRHDDAKIILDDVLKRFPRSAEATTLLGVVHEAKGDHGAALSAHAHALALDPTLALAHVNLGRIYGLKGQWELSAASFQLAITHGAEGTDLQVHFGTALFRARRPSDALRVLSAAVREAPHHLDATLTLADVLVETGALGLARHLLENATPRFPEVPLIAARRAAIALRDRDLEAARAEAWRHTQLAPNDEEAWLFAAVVDTMQLKLDSALEALRRVLALNQRSWRAHYHLGGLFDALKDPVAARASYRAAVECEPFAWEPLNNLATSLLEEGSPASLAEARGLLERAIRRGTQGDAVMLRYNLALACYSLADYPGARAAAQALLKVAPDNHPMVAEARRFLKSTQKENVPHCA